MKFLAVYDPHFNADAPHSRRDNYAESMSSKLTFIRKQSDELGVDFVVIIGDFSHKTTQPTPYLVKMLKELALFRCTVYSLIGNHDVYAANKAFIDKTFLGALFASEQLVRATEINSHHSHRAGTYFQAYDYSLSPVGPFPLEDKEMFEKASWRVGFAHGFIRSKQAGFEVEDVVEVGAFAEAGYDALFVGHDHLEYPDLTIGNMTVYRGGALSRGSKKEHNWIRTPKIHLVDCVAKTVTLISVPCGDADDIFNVEQVDRESADKTIKDFTKLLKTTKLDRVSIFAAIDQVCDDLEVRKECYQRLNTHGIVREG